jgi:SPP1 family predicted phage head-tail adaptor
MTAGTLYERVAFDMPTQFPDGLGGTEEGWSEQFTAFANFKYLRGTETVMAARLTGRQPVVVTIRQSDAARLVTTDWRMRDARRGTVYNVRGVTPTDDRAYLEILCESGVAV